MDRATQEELVSCKKCVLDTTIEEIIFDSKGICNFCKAHDDLDLKYPINSSLTERKWNDLVSKIKYRGRRRKHDCIVGVSGGRDSSYTLLKVVEAGLRPIAVHFDNGWNSEIAVSNIRKLCESLDVELHTHVADWNEFKLVQRAFLEASTSDSEIPTDWAIFSVLFQQARKRGIKYILHGHSFRTEGSTPLSWTYMDGTYVKSVFKRFYRGHKIKSFPIMTLVQFLVYSFIYRIEQIRVLYYFDYKESEALEELSNKVGWRNYGGKHHESKYTSFFQAHILKKKFNIDKRKLHFSALIRSNQLSRNQALELLSKSVEVSEESKAYCLKKLDYTEAEFQMIMDRQIKSFMDYRTSYSLIKKSKPFIKVLNSMGIVPDTVYNKYFLLDESTNRSRS